MASFVADVYCPRAPRVPDAILSPGGLIPIDDEVQLRRRERRVAPEPMETSRPRLCEQVDCEHEAGDEELGCQCCLTCLRRLEKGFGARFHLLFGANGAPNGS